MSIENRDYTHFLHSGYSNDVVRSWQSDITLTPNQLIYPIFVTEKENTKTPINALPEQYQLSCDLLESFLSPLVSKGLKSVLLFAVITDSPKDEMGTIGISQNSPVCRAAGILRQKFPNLLVIADVCLCTYTSHGHCGVLKSDGTIDNLQSLNQLAQISLAFAKAGADFVMVKPAVTYMDIIRDVKNIPPLLPVENLTPNGNVAI